MSVTATTVVGTWDDVDVDLGHAARAVGRAKRFTWLRGELERYTYKPNFTLEMVHIATDRWYDAYLCGTFRAPDSRHTPLDAPDNWPTIALNFTVAVPVPLGDDRDSEMFAVWLRSVLRRVEEHESDEWLRRDGELINDPHSPTGVTP